MVKNNSYTWYLLFGQIWYIPQFEGKISIDVLSQTRGEEFPYSTGGGKAEVGVWRLFTKGLGKNIYTIPNLGHRNEILFKHRVQIG